MLGFLKPKKKSPEGVEESNSLSDDLKYNLLKDYYGFSFAKSHPNHVAYPSFNIYHTFTIIPLEY